MQMWVKPSSDVQELVELNIFGNYDVAGPEYGDGAVFDDSDTGSYSDTSYAPPPSTGRKLLEHDSNQQDNTYVRLYLQKLANDEYAVKMEIRTRRDVPPLSLTGGNVAADKWYHFALERDVSRETLGYYINGIKRNVMDIGTEELNIFDAPPPSTGGYYDTSYPPPPSTGRKLLEHDSNQQDNTLRFANANLLSSMLDNGLGILPRVPGLEIRRQTTPRASRIS